MNRQAEFILVIIGASFSILSFFVAILYAAIFGINAVMMTTGNSYMYADSSETIFFWIFTVGAVIAVIFTIISAVFGFIGAFKIKNDVPKVKLFGICFIILGGLQIFTISGILFVIAGILTLTKKEYKTNHKEDEGIKWE
ncbi:DUF4064 domain-containing protein [Listeria seeligeri]|uniref:DUF4064 domain-containing protein n=1 Tax=Listeria seeligeri TaxID=1640 RepID=UPI0022EBCAAC|nr:DUF4064 domain-containing protein [Listeria seeligeri]